MGKIRCCNIACRHNNAILTKNERNIYYSNVDMGICNCNEDIELIASECDECGTYSEGITCKNFQFKDDIDN